MQLELFSIISKSLKKWITNCKMGKKLKTVNVAHFAHEEIDVIFEFPAPMCFCLFTFVKLAKKKNKTRNEKWLLYLQDFFAIVQQIRLHYFVRIHNLTIIKCIFEHVF